MSLLSKDQILSANDVKIKKVEVPEWGGHVFVRSMTAIQRDDFEVRHAKGTLKNYRATIASRTICDESGALMFSEAEIAQLSQKSSGALSRIYDVAIDLSGVSEEDAQELEKS